jgi:hypothetical protein
MKFLHNQLSARDAVSAPAFHIMSQKDIDAFVTAFGSAARPQLAPEDVMKAVKRGIPVNGQDSVWWFTALHVTVLTERKELALALLKAGADASIKDDAGRTPVLWAAKFGTLETLRLLIEWGGSVNQADNGGTTPLVAVARWQLTDDAAAKLDVLLARPELDLDAKCEGKTAEQWALYKGFDDLAVAIAAEVGWAF